jgi:exopolysaccharide biosynthesis polyprenyl glycosylphosphotransferase
MFTRLRPLIVFLIVADFLATQLALLAADYARRFVPLGIPLHTQPTYLNPVIHLIVAVVFPATFLSLSVYNVRRGARPVGDPFNLTRAVAVATFVFAGMLYFSYRDVPRLMVVYFFFIEWAALAGIRALTLLGLRALRQQGRPLSRVMLVGAGEAASAVVEAVRTRLGDSVVVVGCADDSAASGPGGLPVLGKVDDVPALVRAHAVDEVILTLPSDQYAAAERLAYALLTLPVRVRLVPDYLRLVVVQSSVEALGGIPLIGLREPRISGLTWAVKRVFDVVVTTGLVLLTWPLMLLIALAIRLDSPGPILFKQQRVGENGRLFWMYKFRTMISSADMQAPDVILDEQGRQVYKAPDDKRITRVGRFLRRTSLDELPQFFNVIRGEMSLVGPRPEVQFIVERYAPWQRQRLAVPPGITGWWQVSGRSNLPMHLNTQFDLYYIRNYSLWLDLKILLKTVVVVIRGEGAY